MWLFSTLTFFRVFDYLTVNLLFSVSEYKISNGKINYGSKPAKHNLIIKYYLRESLREPYCYKRIFL